MKCFHCKAETEICVDGRALCASAECNLMAHQAELFESLRVPADVLRGEDSAGNVAGALAHREYMANLYGKVIGE